MNWKHLFAVIGLGIISTLPSAAQTYAWTDWTSATTGQSGVAAGSLQWGSSSVNVSYSGEILFANTNGGSNYWLPTAIYTSAAVPNSPLSPDGIFLQGGWGVTQRITFSQPVMNPALTILSLGRPTIECRYVFNQPFNIASQGQGYWGGTSNSLVKSGNTLIGTEGHGTIVFPGLHTSLTWTAPYQESWHGFQVGAMRAVPEPATMSALALGCIALARRKKRRA
ncbi:MAG TPA: PEP-CTERM sorting domain-containing protein [Fimbriimonadaceae bacterium]|nr:PEP-CTERM sorting domain-containing protein [Fimbriimonadaceae bacterium]HRJ32570.1 PEP-CTERM sorting domain-containing protein [Fimbriimonadaceae bacterium]